MLMNLVLVVASVWTDNEKRIASTRMQYLLSTYDGVEKRYTSFVWTEHRNSRVFIDDGHYFPDKKFDMR